MQASDLCLPAGLTLRRASAADDTSCRDLYASTRADLRALPLPPLMLENLIGMQYQVQQQGQRQHFPLADTFLVEQEASAVGQLVIDTSTTPWRLVALIVTPAMQGRGIGTAVLAALQQRAAGHADILLAVAQDNHAAQRLYQRCGFAIWASRAPQNEMRWDCSSVAVPHPAPSGA